MSALHPILPVYFNILSPGISTYSNFEIVIIIFELKNKGRVTTKRCLFFCSELRNSCLFEGWMVFRGDNWNPLSLKSN